MNQIQTNTNPAPSYNSSNFKSQRTIASVIQSTNETQIPVRNMNSASYVKAPAELNTINSDTVSRRVNNVTALIQSVDASAASIENKLTEIQDLAIQDGCGCQTIKRAMEAISKVANEYTWNGVNYMAGGGEKDQTTTQLNIKVNDADNSEQSLKISFKSFDPMSAVDTDGEDSPVIPNLPDLNKSDGTDTHAYGDAALYSGSDSKNHLHTHTEAMREHAIIQLTRAIDGISSERARLAGYLKKIYMISKASQKRDTDLSQRHDQIQGREQARLIAKFLKENLLSRPLEGIPALSNFNDPKLRLLLS